MRKSIIYTDHATERMHERGIAEADVRSAVTEPNIKMPGNNPGTTRVQKTLRKGQNLQVIYKEKKKTILIITVCWKQT